MIPKALNAITEEDLQALITNGVAEGRMIDYKRDLPGNSDVDKKELLADVSSFANTGGGDLVFGMGEAGGLPTQITGTRAMDLDLEVRRLDSIIAAGLSPRIRHSIKPVTTAAGPSVLIIRIERSWAGPHRVIYGSHDKFYGRNSGGKYPLDVNELRAAFTLSSTATEKIRAFRTDRIIALSDGQTPIPFMGSSKVILHFIPLEAFSGGPTYDMRPLYQNPQPLAPMGTGSWNYRLNLDGIVTFGTAQPCPAYTQLFRNGVLEVVQGRILAGQHEGRQVIPSMSFEDYIMRYLPQCFRLLETIGAGLPIVVAMTLTHTKGLWMGVDTFLRDEAGYPIDAETITLPETIVETFAVPTQQIVKPMFDLIWNACGFPGSQNFDADGNWVTRRR
jgi:Putative DNA-binding domain